MSSPNCHLEKLNAVSSCCVHSITAVFQKIKIFIWSKYLSKYYVGTGTTTLMSTFHQTMERTQLREGKKDRKVFISRLSWEIVVKFCKILSITIYFNLGCYQTSYAPIRGLKEENQVTKLKAFCTDAIIKSLTFFRNQKVCY